MSAHGSEASEAIHEPGKGPACLPLSSLKPGIRARLCSHSETSVPTRLLDLGLVPDTSLVVVRTAPLGDPFEVELRGYRLCLRRADVVSLCVLPEAPQR
jgi:Fe2+ transport system protein FeoA